MIGLRGDVANGNHLQEQSDPPLYPFKIGVIMTMDKIIREIIKRADEDFKDDYQRSRAKSHFRSAVYSLLSATDTTLDETDYPNLVKTEKLVLLTNCVLPDKIHINLSKDYYRLLGGYIFPVTPEGYSVMIVPSINEFNRTVNNPLSQYHNVVYVHLIGQRLIVDKTPPDNCYIKYIKQLPQNVFSGDNVRSMFSMRFIHAGIEIAVGTFKAEIGAV